MADTVLVVFVPVGVGKRELEAAVADYLDSLKIDARPDNQSKCEAALGSGDTPLWMMFMRNPCP